MNKGELEVRVMFEFVKKSMSVKVIPFVFVEGRRMCVHRKSELLFGCVKNLNVIEQYVVKFLYSLKEIALEIRSTTRYSQSCYINAATAYEIA